MHARIHGILSTYNRCPPCGPNRPRGTLQNTLAPMAVMARFTIKTLLYGVENLELSKYESIIQADYSMSWAIAIYHIY